MYICNYKWEGTCFYLAIDDLSNVQRNGTELRRNLTEENFNSKIVIVVLKVSLDKSRGSLGIFTFNNQKFKISHERRKWKRMWLMKWQVPPEQLKPRNGGQILEPVCSKTSDRISYLKAPAKNVLTSFRRPPSTCRHPLDQIWDKSMKPLENLIWNCYQVKSFVKESEIFSFLGRN